jgi:hypothetical protein
MIRRRATFGERARPTGKRLFFFLINTGRGIADAEAVCG